MTAIARSPKPVEPHRNSLSEQARLADLETRSKAFFAEIARLTQALAEWNREASRHFAGSEYHDDPKNVFARVQQLRDSHGEAMKENAKLRRELAEAQQARERLVQACGVANETCYDALNQRDTANELLRRALELIYECAECWRGKADAELAAAISAHLKF